VERLQLPWPGEPRARASKGTQFAYLCMTSALVTRIVMALMPEYALPLMDVAATL
jgi:hypothetical protein